MFIATSPQLQMNMPSRFLKKISGGGADIARVSRYSEGNRACWMTAMKRTFTPPVSFSCAWAGGHPSDRG